MPEIYGTIKYAEIENLLTSDQTVSLSGTQVIDLTSNRESFIRITSAASTPVITDLTNQIGTGDRRILVNETATTVSIANGSGILTGNAATVSLLTGASIELVYSDSNWHVMGRPAGTVDAPSGAISGAVAGQIIGATGTDTMAGVVGTNLTTQYLILPSISEATRDGLSASERMIVYNADQNEYQFYDGTTWTGLGGSTRFKTKAISGRSTNVSTDGTLPSAIHTFSNVPVNKVCRVELSCDKIVVDGASEYCYARIDNPQDGASAQSFTDAEVTVGTDSINIASHGFVTGDIVSISTTSGAIPTGLTAGQEYAIIATDSDNFKFAERQSAGLSAYREADGGNEVTIAAAPTGTNTVYHLDRGGLGSFDDDPGVAAGEMDIQASYITEPFTPENATISIRVYGETTDCYIKNLKATLYVDDGGTLTDAGTDFD